MILCYNIPEKKTPQKRLLRGASLNLRVVSTNSFVYINCNVRTYPQEYVWKIIVEFTDTKSNYSDTGMYIAYY
jgi:hypothetical protein